MPALSPPHLIELAGLGAALVLLGAGRWLVARWLRGIFKDLREDETAQPGVISKDN